MNPWEKHLTAYVLVVIAGVGVIMTHRIIFYPRFMTRVSCYRIGFLDNDKIGYVAVRSLHKNHLIADGDLQRVSLPSSLRIRKPNVAGRYLMRDVAEGAVINESDAREEPLVIPRPGRSLVTLPASDEAVRSGAIDAGNPVLIIAGNNTVAGTVEAIVGINQRSALVNVTLNDARAIASRDSKAPPAVVIPMLAEPAKGNPVDQKTWTEILTIEAAPVDSPWIRAIDYVPAGTLLKFECKDPAKRVWTYHDGKEATCGPDGDARAAVGSGETLPLATAPLGCLLGKLGGSTLAVTATATTSDGAVFAVGSFCIRKVGDSEGGPLYLGVNAGASKLPPSKAGSIAVTISEAKP